MARLQRTTRVLQSTRLRADALRRRHLLNGKECPGMAGAGACAARADRLGEALDRAASLGALCGLTDSGAHHRSMAAGGVARAQRRRDLEHALLAQHHRALHQGLLARGTRLYERTPQLAGQVSARAAAIPAALDAGGRSSAGALVAARAPGWIRRHCLALCAVRESALSCVAVARCHRTRCVRRTLAPRPWTARGPLGARDAAVAGWARP